MATDYDAPRKTEEDLSEDSLQELQARRSDKNSGVVDEDAALVNHGESERGRTGVLCVRNASDSAWVAYLRAALREQRAEKRILRNLRWR